MGDRGNSALSRTFWDGRAYKRHKIFQEGHQFKFGDVVRYNADTDEYVLAIADTGENAEAVGIVVASGAENQASEEYLRKAHPSPKLGNELTQEAARKHYFSIVYRGEITIPYNWLGGEDGELLHHSNDFLSQYEEGAVYF